MSYSSNMPQVLLKLENSLKKIEETDKPLLTAATTIMASIVERVHEKGKKADGSSIGQYTASTIRSRVKKQNTARGVSSARSGSKKVILSDTRTLENSYGIESIVGGWAIGFENPGGAEPPPDELVRILEKKYGVVWTKLSKKDEKTLRTQILKFINTNLP